MKIQQYTQYIKILKHAIYKKGSYGEIQTKIHSLVSGIENILFIDMLCKQLENAFVHQSSEIVNKATFILTDLAFLNKEQLSQRMAQKGFQDNLVYTLRRKTSILGNRFTMHPMLWRQIQTRVLRVYQFWWNNYMMEEDKYHQILEKYRYLKSLKISFPQQLMKTEQKKIVINVNSKTQYYHAYQNKIEEQNISEQQINKIEEQIQLYQKVMKKNQLKVLNTQQNIQYLRKKSIRLFNIFNEKCLMENVQNRLKNLYERMRIILKAINQNKQKVAMQKEKTFYESKKAGIFGLFKSKSDKQPQKEQNNNQSPIKYLQQDDNQNPFEQTNMQFFKKNHSTEQCNLPNLDIQNNKNSGVENLIIKQYTELNNVEQSKEEKENWSNYFSQNVVDNSQK